MGEWLAITRYGARWGGEEDGGAGGGRETVFDKLSFLTISPKATTL